MQRKGTMVISNIMKDDNRIMFVRLLNDVSEKTLDFKLHTRKINFFSLVA